MSDVVVVALIGLLGSALGTFGGVMASARLMQYRIQQLEKKVDAHNNLIERTYRLEGRMDNVESDVNDLKRAG